MDLIKSSSSQTRRSNIPKAARFRLPHSPCVTGPGSPNTGNAASPRSGHRIIVHGTPNSSRLQPATPSSATRAQLTPISSRRVSSVIEQDFSSRFSRDSETALLSSEIPVRRDTNLRLPLTRSATTTFIRAPRRANWTRFPEPRYDAKTKHKPQWTTYKKVLFYANILLTLYSSTLLIFFLLAWLKTFYRADIIRVANRPELVLSTAACLLGVLASAVGWAGILLNNRTFLGTYTLLLWLMFVFMVIPGYITYKRRTFNLEGKINSQWSEDLGTLGRLTIQNGLRCCGYFSPFVEASISQTCYARSRLPGCKLAFLNFERRLLKRWYIVAFAVVPLHLLVMVASLLCSNHVTYRFGKGMTPVAYRVRLADMAMEKYTSAHNMSVQNPAQTMPDLRVQPSEIIS